MRGALDMLPASAQSNGSNKVKASALLDGAVHACVPWLPATLAALDEAMHASCFWIRRKGDAYIRGFGGPYVLGQDEDKLKLIHGAEHTELTSMVARAHSLIYTVTHLRHPPAPGFNTLIFGLNLRSAGFYYHSDAEVPGLPAKNAPLVPNQPVVTTVLYAAPDEDGGKELVLWRPSLNFDVAGPFSAARALQTPHGCAHIQRAGLQRQTKHGVFHAPGTAARESWRVALTARVTKANAAALTEACATRKAYSEHFGPEGEWTLPRVLSTPGQ